MRWRGLRVGIASSCKTPVKLELGKLRLARLLGADSFFVPDHLRSNVPSRSGSDGRWTPADAFLDPLAMLAAMATRSRRIRLGVGVTDAFRRHPATLAQSAVTLDHLSRGRAILGLGAGSRENLEPYGTPFADRLRRLDEALTVIRLLWESRGEPVDFDGSVWRLRGALFATPLHAGAPPPIWLGAHAPAMLRLAGRHADGWYPTIRMTAGEYAAGLGTIREAATAAGRDPDRFEPALQVFLALGPGRGRVLEKALRSPAAAPLLLSLPATVWERHGLRHPLGDGRGFSDFMPSEATAQALDAARRAATPELLADGVLAGSPGEIVEEIRPLLDAGLRHVVLANVGPGFRGARPDDLVRLGLLVRRLRRLQLPPRAA